MNKDKKIEELYKLTFKEVHASNELKGMVSNMADNKKIVWKKIVWKRIYKNRYWSSGGCYRKPDYASGYYPCSYEI